MYEYSIHIKIVFFDILRYVEYNLLIY